jgi:hypothetical protein
MRSSFPHCWSLLSSPNCKAQPQLHPHAP